jgi:hypothetical protein
VLLVPEDICNESRLARPSLSYEDADLVVPHSTRVEFPQLERHSCNSWTK